MKNKAAQDQDKKAQAINLLQEVYGFTIVEKTIPQPENREAKTGFIVTASSCRNDWGVRYVGGDIDDNYTTSYFDESEIFGSKLDALISAIVRLQACKNTAIELLKIEIPIDISY